MKLILMGAPGAGKGTQSAKISQIKNIPAVSTGDMLRAAVREKTELGKAAKSYMDAGNLVPDEVVIGIIRDYLKSDVCKNGFILDGFPRSIPQAEALDKMGVEIDAAISIEVADEKIVERMSGRRICSGCSASYHVKYNPPKIADVCDICASSLFIRDDDKAETVLRRLGNFHDVTEPLKDYYAAKGKLVLVEGKEKVEDTSAGVAAALAKIEAKQI